LHQLLFINYNHSVLQIKQTETFRKWERKLKDQRAKALIAARLFRLANGLAGDVTPVGRGLSELRIHYGAGYRIYFKQQGDELIILLCGGDKSTQQQDIKLATQLNKELRASE
jgi:putative addiction module killer protein